MTNTIRNFAHKISSFSGNIDKTASKLHRDERGIAAIEMAFIFPVMIVLLIGLVDVTDGMSASRKVTITANTLGDLISQEPGTTDQANLDGIFAGATQTMIPFDGSSLGLEIFNFRKIGNNAPKLNWQHRAGTNCGAIPAVTADMSTLMTQGNDLIISRACYNFSYILGNLFPGKTSFAMKEAMTLRPRKSLQLDCTDC